MPGPGKFRREGLSPLVGDWVQVRELGGGEGFVEAVEPRRNAFDRPAAANIDQLVIIASAALPVTDPYLIDRISAIAALKDCRVLLCLNKCDLDPAEELYGIYSGSAIRVLRVSAVTGPGDRRAVPGAGRKAQRLHRQLRRGEVQHSQRPGPPFFPGGGGGQQGPGPGTAHHPPCGAVFPGAGHLCHRHPGLASFDTQELDLELKEHLPETFPEFGPLGRQAAALWGAATPRRRAAPCWRPSIKGRSPAAATPAICGCITS